MNVFARHKIPQIINYWFGTKFIDEFPPRHVSDKWYLFEKATDDYIRRNYADDVEQALNNKYDSWLLLPNGQLALILLLDQFTRHIYRNTKDAFIGDPKAREIVYDNLDKGIGYDLLCCQQMFYFAPLEHSENFKDQCLLKKLYQEIDTNLSDKIKNKLEYYKYWFDVHYQVIEKYGRFPWRNIILSRESTKEELEYLKTLPNFGQGN